MYKRTFTAIRRVPTALSLFFFRTQRDRRPKRNVFNEKKIYWRLYGDHGDCTAIMLRLHGVYIATACDLWAFVPRSNRFHYVSMAFLRSFYTEREHEHDHCEFSCEFPHESLFVLKAAKRVGIQVKQGNL
jgi:hypothetical protein